MTQELHGVISLGGTVIGGSLNQRGLKGETGNGIESVVMTEEYNLVITYTDGDVVTLDTGLDDYEELLKGYKDDAESAKSNAESAKTDAVDAKNDAVSAKSDAVSAKNDAVSAKNDAESAKSDAVSAKNDAVSAKTDAQSAKTAAETAQGKAEDAQGYAETAQTAAETAATNANTYQGWAQNYASNAQTQAGYASTHRWAAYDSQVAAAASALVSEGYANGEQNGTPVTSDSPYYHNNAKYYSEKLINILPTDTASGAIASFEDGSDLFDYLSCIVNIEPVQAGSGTPSPDNVRPITGWTGCEVDVVGVNVWDEEWELGGIGSSTGVPYSSSTSIRSKNFCKCVADQTYYFKGTFACYWYDENQSFIKTDYVGNNTKVAPTNARYFKIALYEAYGTTYKNDISINYPSTDTDYHAYNGTTYPVSWQTEAGTVYGGKLDVVSGVLTVDRASVDLGTLNWNKLDTTGGNYRFFASAPDCVIAPNASTVPNMLCSIYPTVTPTGTYIGTTGVSNNVFTPQILVCDMSYADAQTFKTAMSGVQLVYELATPQTYQLDPVQVACLLGQNNVWADCGDIEEVKYKADVQKWVEKQLREINTAILALS